MYLIFKKYNYRIALVIMISQTLRHGNKKHKSCYEDQEFDWQTENQ